MLSFSVGAFAQTPAAGSEWEHLKALPAGSHLHVSADHGGATCKLVSVDESTLICGKHSFSRPEVKKIKLTRYGTSYLVGVAIGAGAGAGVGLGISAATNDAFFVNDKATFAGAGAALGAVIGLLVTGPADLLRGPTVYRR
jgi:hypothetical protein